MKIAQFIDTCGPGGAETMVLEISRALAKYGCDVVILHFENQWLEKKCEDTGLSHIRLSSHRIYKSIYSLPIFSIYLGYVLKRLDIDLLHSHLFGSIVAGSFAAKLAGITHIGTMHDSYTLTEKPNYCYLLAGTVLLGSQTVVVSKIMRDTFLGLKPRLKMDYRVIKNGLDLKQFDASCREDVREKMGVKPETTMLLHVGRLVDIKRQDLIVHAMSLIDMRPKWRLYIVGDGPNFKKIQSLIDEMGLRDNIVLLGHREDVKDLLIASDCFILASNSEGLSCSLIEAMAAGLPIVATHVGGNSELVQDGVSGYLVEKGNHEELARRIEALIKDPSKRREFSARAGERAKKFYSTEQMMQNYMRLYQVANRDS